MARTTITRLRTKASQDRSELNLLLDSVHIGHFALVAEDGQPVVLPTAVARDGDRMLAHGSTGSGWIRRLAAGTPTSLAVTSLDALVVARSAFESSMRYRSVVIFGQCTPLTDPDEKLRALDTVVEALLPGRLAEVRSPTRKELAKTLVLALPITEWSLKVSAGWPDDPPEDCAGLAWAGVIPVEICCRAAIPAPGLRTGIPVPESVRRIQDSSV
jgi:uncharacterized protein